MCGRYAIYGPVSRKNREALQFLDRELTFGPIYNAAPTQELPVYRVTARDGRELKLLRWGLVPFRANSVAVGAGMINARAETLADKPAFREAFGRRHCLVPMSGFYEWRRLGSIKVPYYIHPLNADVFAVAGLYEFWPGKNGAPPVESFTIVTTQANELVRTLHERMPAILHEADYEAWLAPQDGRKEDLAALLAPYPAEEMRAHPVSPLVNNAKNEGPDLLVEAEAPPSLF